MLWRRLRAGADPRPTPAPSATRAASGCSRGVRGCRCTPNESSRQRGEVGHALGAEQVGAATLRQSSNDNRVVTRNSTAVAVVPRPNLKPYFFCAASPGGRQPGRKSAYWRKRRGSVSQQRHPDGYVRLADAPERRPVGRSRRSASVGKSRSKLDPEQVAELRRLAPGRSLRSLAAVFGVSHETVRTALRAEEPAEVA
jgi:DNA-binding CsgD family transcriptional regulator